MCKKYIYMNKKVKSSLTQHCQCDIFLNSRVNRKEEISNTYTSCKKRKVQIKMTKTKQDSGCDMCQFFFLKQYSLQLNKTSLLYVPLLLYTKTNYHS